MALITAPPHLFHRPADNLCWLNISVAHKVPLCHELRVCCCKRVFICNDFPANTVWTLASRCSNLDTCQITVPLFAFPPHFFVGTSRHVVWRERVILLLIPFIQQIPHIGSAAIIMQRFSHGPHLAFPDAFKFAAI